MRTPTETLILTLSARGYLPAELNALELFGMCGLWITKDYAGRCSYLEFYETNSIYAKYAHRFLPNATIVNADSIQAVRQNRLRRPDYNFIMCDNPLLGPFGNGYYEHFDLFPELGAYISSGILAINFIHDPDLLKLSVDHIQRREKFYGTFRPSVIQAVARYEELVSHRKIVDFVFLPRNNALSFIALVFDGRQH